MSLYCHFISEYIPGNQQKKKKLKKKSLLTAPFLGGYVTTNITFIFFWPKEYFLMLSLSLQVEFIIFQPTVGCVLKGTVNQIAKSHISCLMHSSFNASISRPQTTLTAWDGSALKLGQEFLFEVTSIESQNGLLFMRGELGME